jgi:antitoxin (DNA-binding transcriptional repressor) of toxin-antitoxin stability system
MTKMGVREFRDNFTTIAREAKAPVIVTNHDQVVGWFTPANKPQRSVSEILTALNDVRRSAEARGVNVAARLKALGIEDETLFADPWTEAQPLKRKSKAAPRRRK